MKVPVVWFSWHDSPARGYYDQTLLDWLFAQEMPGGFEFEHRYDFPDKEQGIVLVTPGHWRSATEVNQELHGRPWALVIITSDEEGECPYWDLRMNGRMSIWKHTPRAELPFQPDRALPLGWTPGTVEANVNQPKKTEDWFFGGQITHGRREQAAQVLRTMGNGKLVETDHFLATDVMNHPEYLDHMRRARVIPCPSGPNIPDSFRFYEALESGAVPLADATCPRGDWGYWHRVFGSVPFPVVEDWQTLPELVEQYKSQECRVEVLSWWEQAKRDLLWRLHDDIANLKGEADKPGMEDRITVLISTSPIPSHPWLDVIEVTVASVRAKLRNAEIIVMADGVRPELEHRRNDYLEYLERLVWRCRSWHAVPLIFDEFQHQANMTRRALEMVRTELILYVEHDTPLVGDIPWNELGYFLLNDEFWVIRFHHENAIPSAHKYLMKDIANLFKSGRDHKFMRTVQWSQRPHLARTDKYRDWIEAYFPVTSRTFIEDRMHGVVETAKWDKFRVGIYHPRGGIKRSTHLDGRQDDPKAGTQW